MIQPTDNRDIRDADYQRVTEGITRTAGACAECVAFLLEYRDKSLYARDGKSFEDAVRAKWPQLGRTNIYRLMQAEDVRKELQPQLQICSGLAPDDSAKAVLPNNRVAQAIAQAAPKGARKDLWEDVKATAPKDAKGQPKITAAVVQQVAAKRVETPAAQPSPVNVDKQPALPWAEFEETRQILTSQLHAIRERLGRLTGANKATNKNSVQWAYFMPPATTVLKLDEVIKCLEENAPGAASNQAPGFIPVRMTKQGAKQ